MISYIIPTYNRVGILLWHLRELASQSLAVADWECIVVNDGGEHILTDSDLLGQYRLSVIDKENGGPASARNAGVQASHGDVLLFVGDDCIPSNNLLYHHWLRHKQSNTPIGIQGYTDWHPKIPPDSFHAWLHNGLQANWGSLKTENGAWISRDKELHGWALTTNFSISRSEFERLGGFCEEFPHAAWEDVELSLRASMFNMKTFFEPDALNYHFHRQTLDGFVKRQMTEGASRIILVSKHPHMASNMLDPEGLRNVTPDILSQAVELARELHYNDSPDLQEARQRRWQNAFQMASLMGIKNGLAERSKKSPIWQAVEHLHIGDAIMHVVGAAVAYEQGDLDYAMFCSEWANRAEPAAWVMDCIRGEVLLKMGNTSEAMSAFFKALERGPNEAWPKERIANGAPAH